MHKQHQGLFRVNTKFFTFGGLRVKRAMTDVAQAHIGTFVQQDKEHSALNYSSEQGTIFTFSGR